MNGTIQRAIDLATKAHEGQVRAGTMVPYVAHPVECAALLRCAGVRDDDVLAAAVLHDVVEDTQVTLAEVEAVMGPRVAAIVAEVTDPKGLTGREAKARQYRLAVGDEYGYGAALVKIADSVSNVTDISRRTPPWSRERLSGYAAVLRRLVAVLRGVGSAEVEALCAVFDTSYEMAMVTIAEGE